METRFGEVAIAYSARGIPTFTFEVFHEGLHKHAFLRAMDERVLHNKAQMQAALWNDLWQKQLLAETRVKGAHEAKEARRLHLENQKAKALQRTAEAQDGLEALRSTLVRGIVPDPTLDWEAIKIRTPFPKKAPITRSLPEEPLPPPFPLEPLPKSAPTEPMPSDFKYQVRLSVIDRLIRSRKYSKHAEVNNLFEVDIRHWRDSCAMQAAEHQANLTAWRARCARVAEEHETAVEAVRKERNRLQEQHERAIAGWQTERKHFEEEQAKQHEAIDDLRQRYELKSPDAVTEYCERVLSGSDYPPCIPREFDFDLYPETNMLLLNCRLPPPGDLPTLSEVKYVQMADTLREIFLSESQLAKLYDDVVYQITLRTIHELFQSDSVGAISTIVFNGIVTSTDKSTGNEVTACIISVQASREPFLAINLAKVDPKACFRQLKGVGSSKIHSVTPVAPIVELKRDDRRFVPSYAVAQRLNDGYNLATMDWEDFEHLIREIFGKEFSSGGGEVKVTQASRDGGVDAVAFDPDPIRGGKIVIQAKRYAYTVGVSAVRDLYGTVMNEGASKGILVTTSDYGPDAYQFANGKPLTLLSGSNLLHLLAKHGVGAHIDLNEARKAAQERSTRVEN
ncbi:MAG: restriction endonuclease [Candidatus Sulfotelmatobacter sp.]|nr:restriction endonuclease [Candidatus Sulfotelmatobacter sp.]